MRLVCERDVGFRREKARFEVLEKALRRIAERRVGRIILAGCGVVLGAIGWEFGVRGSRRVKVLGLRHRLPRDRVSATAAHLPLEKTSQDGAHDHNDFVIHLSIR